MPERNNKKPPYTLVEMLRIIPRSSLPIGVAWNKCEEAADRIEALEAALKKVWKLYPFKEEEGHVDIQDMVKRFIEVGEVARAALAGEKKDGD